MGGNGAYSTASGRIPDAKRKFYDTDNRIDGHKILLSKENVNHIKVPMNSNSENPVYLCAKVEKKTKELHIEKIAVYRKHKIVEVIDLEFDKNGNYIPYSNGGKGTSHSHKWNTDENGNMGRKSHDRKNVFPIDRKYSSLIEKIVQFNKSKRKWNGK